jgi:hypothetical protein
MSALRLYANNFVHFFYVAVCLVMSGLTGAYNHTSHLSDQKPTELATITFCICNQHNHGGHHQASSATN